MIQAPPYRPTKSPRPRVVLITSDHLRHRVVARTVARDVRLVGVIRESKPVACVAPQELARDEPSRRILRQHMQGRDQAEARHFDQDVEFPDVEMLLLARGEVSSHAALRWVQRLRPEAILLYGSGIVRGPLATAFPGRMLNLHLGLSPYYRGSATNFFPLVNRQPECVGYTVHIASSEVDAGHILRQGRPDIMSTDDAHDIGCRAILRGARAFGMTAVEFLQGRRNSHPSTSDIRGRVYRHRDFNALAVRRMWENFSQGMIADYLEDRKRRDDSFPIVQ